MKRFRRVGGPSLQYNGKPVEIIVGRVTSRGVFQFFHTFRGFGGGGCCLFPLPGGERETKKSEHRHARPWRSSAVLKYLAPCDSS